MAAEQQENRQAEENRKNFKDFVSQDFSQTAKPRDQWSRERSGQTRQRSSSKEIWMWHVFFPK